MSALARYFFEICLLRKGPQDLPGSRELVILTAFVYMTLSTVIMLDSFALKEALASSSLELIAIAGLSYLILKVNRHPERLLQTLTAILGCGCIISLIAVPVIFSGFLGESGFVGGLATLAYLLLVIWDVLIVGHILRHALNTTLGFGIVFAIIYLVIISILITAVLPVSEMS